MTDCGTSEFFAACLMPELIADLRIACSLLSSDANSALLSSSSAVHVFEIVQQAPLYLYADIVSCRVGVTYYDALESFEDCLCRGLDFRRRGVIQYSMP